MVSIWDNNKIRQARKDAEFTPEQTATFLNVTVVYVYMLENGKRQPSQKLIAQMSGLFKKPISFFLKEEKNFALA